MASLIASATLCALALLSGAVVRAEPVTTCPADGICYRVGVPSASAASGDGGSIYLQLRAPANTTWAALGTGSMMAGANMFVMYADGAGNVTVSPRTGTGHVPPSPNTETRLQLLAGSGVVDNAMVANVRCDNCASWNGGSMSLGSSSTNWIAAWKSGAAIDSTDVNAPISRHDAHKMFTINLQQAVIANDANPFAGSAVGGTGEATNPPSGNSGFGMGAGAVPWYIRSIHTIVRAHGIIMAIVMVALYPLGSMLMPLFGKWWLHAGWQVVAYLLMWAGFGLGVTAAKRTGLDFGPSHTRLGTVVVALFGLQPIGGYLHHLHYVKHQRRGVVSHVHIWYGRALMIMGITNGGLGLTLAHASKRFIIAYSVVAAVLFLAYIGAAVFGELKKRRNTPNPQQGGRKYGA
ncbi:iron reductase domain protein [Xylariaceae sp. FL0804]|nr:iron reductase domain protein [Xylariaceae sp. FL0804]